MNQRHQTYGSTDVSTYVTLHTHNSSCSTINISTAVRNVCLSVCPYSCLAILHEEAMGHIILSYVFCHAVQYSAHYVKQEKSSGQVIELKCASSFPLTVCLKDVKCCKLQDIEKKCTYIALHVNYGTFLRDFILTGIL